MQEITYWNGIKIVKILDEELLLSSKEVRESRIEICKSCDYFSNDTCQHCSCLISVRTAYVDSYCPVGKW